MRTEISDVIEGMDMVNNCKFCRVEKLQKKKKNEIKWNGMRYKEFNEWYNEDIDIKLNPRREIL